MGKGKWVLATCIFAFIESLTFSIYFTRGLITEDFLWAFPIIVVSAVLGLFALDGYSNENRIDEDEKKMGSSAAK